MTGTLSRWVDKQRSVYFGNAATKRDMRVQLRGSKAIILWTAYLAVLVCPAILIYAGVASDADIMPAIAQSRLHACYQAVLAALGIAVSLIASTLGATAIVSERQRRSLDLVFTTPVTPKYYLVGKLLSVYRYIWMLMLLSLPVVSVGIVMGGASWTDLFKSFIVISLDALVYSVVGLAISSGAEKMTSAVVATFLMLAGLFAANLTLVGSPLSAPSGGVSVAQGFLPFSGAVGLSSTTLILGVNMPSILLFSLAALALVYVGMLAAGSALSPWHIRETTALRIGGLALLGVWVYGWCAGSGSPVAFLSAMMPFALVAPTISAYTRNDPPKFIYDGPSKFSNAFRATPSGALPYLVLMVATGAFSAIMALGTGALASVLAQAAYVMGAFLMLWGLARISSKLATGLASARALAAGIGLFVFAFPSLAFSLLHMYGAGATVGDGVPLAPFTSDRPLVASVAWGAVFLVAAFVLAAASGRVQGAVWKAHEA